MESNPGICILSVPADAETAVKLAASIRAYQLPRGVTVPSGVKYPVSVPFIAPFSVT